MCEHKITDYLKDGTEGVVGKIMGEDLNENVVLHRDDAGRSMRSRSSAAQARCSIWNASRLKGCRSAYLLPSTRRPAEVRLTEAPALERRLSDLVNRAYGLTPEDVDLLWSTAPSPCPDPKKGAIEDDVSRDW